MKIANMRVIIDFIKHKKKKNQSLWRETWSLATKKTIKDTWNLSQNRFKKKAFYNQIWKKKQKEAKKGLTR